MDHHISDAMEMVDHMPYPAFCVKEGIIVKANPAALARMIEPDMSIDKLLATGIEEYSQFENGNLYLNLSIQGSSTGAAVTRKNGFDLFRLEQDADRAELQAMALAARELREPLASVMITADRLFPVSGLADDPATQEQVARINRGLYQMLRVISNMADANRYAAESGSNMEVRDVCGILRETFSKAAALVEQTGITLEYTDYPDSIYTMVDGERLERAVLNIISNAVKFTPSGGSIFAKLTRKQNKLYLSIQDTGSGIADALRPGIFSRYTREPGLEDGRFGIGLGFVLIRSTAALHGGTVLVDQPEETGTRITMTLAIRPGEGDRLRSPILRVDYSGERDHGLLELSDVLPAKLYTPENI